MSPGKSSRSKKRSLPGPAEAGSRPWSVRSSWWSERWWSVASAIGASTRSSELQALVVIPSAEGTVESRNRALTQAWADVDSAHLDWQAVRS